MKIKSTHSNTLKIIPRYAMQLFFRISKHLKVCSGIRGLKTFKLYYLIFYIQFKPGY